MMWNIRQVKRLFVGDGAPWGGPEPGSETAETTMDHRGAAPSGPVTPVHFFLHIPKCGGNTLSDFLSRHFPVSAIYTAEKSTADWLAHQQLKAGLSSDEEVRRLTQRYATAMLRHDLVVENHFTWRTLQLVAAERPVISYALLREPRERVASHYLHLRRIAMAPSKGYGSENTSLYSLARECSLADFCQKLDRHDVWATIFNLQTRCIRSHRLGRGSWETIGEQAIFEDALSNLTQINHVADLADLDEFTRFVSLANHWLPPGQLMVHNPGDGPTAAQELAGQVPDEVVSLDQALYEAGRKQYAAWRERLLHESSIALWKASRPDALAGDRWELSFADGLPGINFHAREGGGDTTLRWLGPDRTTQLFLPVRVGRPHALAIGLVAVLEPDRLHQTCFRINGSTVVPSFTASGQQTVVNLPVAPEQTATGLIELTIEVDRVTSAAALGQGEDWRMKSLAVNQISIAVVGSP